MDMRGSNFNPKNIDEYIAQFPLAVQTKLNSIRATMRKVAPDAEEAMSYGIPTFKLHGNLVHFAGYKNHIGFYPGSVGIEAFQKELQGYETSKGTVQFPLDKTLPLKLIAAITKFRVLQNKEKASEKKVKKVTKK